MAVGSKICAECGGLNSQDATRCQRCAAEFPGPLAKALGGWIASTLGKDVPVTRLYVGLCLLMYAVTVADGAELSIMGGASKSTLLRWGALRACDGGSEIWRYVSPLFLHSGLLHLGMNMMGLVNLGRMLEPQLGSARFAVLFVSTVVSGFIFSDIWYSDLGASAALCAAAELRPGYLLHAPITVGASGGIVGLVGAFLGYLYARKDPNWKPIATKIAIYSVLFAVLFPVNNAAHLGGLVLGIVLGILFCKERRPWKRRRLFGVLCASCITASLASIALSAQSDVWRVQRAYENQARTR